MAAVPSAPGAPSVTAYTDGSGQISVSWGAPASNGAPITNYQVEDNDGQTWQTGGTSLTIGGFSNGTAYQFEVQAYNSAGWGSYSGWSSWVTPYGPPAAPSGVTATPGNGSALVSWAAPNDNGSAITSFTVTAADLTTAGNGGQTCQWSTGALSCTVSGLTDGDSYTFTVTAANAAGNSSASSPSSAVTPVGVPSAPGHVAVVRHSESASVSWTASSSNGSKITRYTVTASPGGRTCTWTSGALACTLTGLVNGQTYTAAVIATNGPGNSLGTISAPFTPATTPSAPTGLLAVAGNNAATITWKVPADGGSAITGYTATSSPGGKSCSTKTNSCTVSGLALGTRYSFTVGAINAVGSGTVSLKSNTVLIGTPSAPTHVELVSGNGNLVAAWAQAAGNGFAVSSYTATAEPGGKTCSTPALSCQITGLTNGTKYSVTVVAKNTRGQSPGSVSVSGTPYGPPTAPTAVTARSANQAAIVSWSRPTNVGSGIVEYVVTASPGGRTCTWTSGTLSCEVSGLRNGSRYTFKVVAADAQGDSQSSVASASVLIGLPWSPSSVVASPRNASAVVTWKAPSSGGGPISSYLVLAWPGGKSCTWTAGPLTCTVGGLTNGVAYRFTVTARSTYGSSRPSPPSNTVTPLDVPSPPLDVAAAAGVRSLAVTWSAPSTGTAGITHYTAAASPGGRSCTWTSGPLACTITGLANGTSYAVTVTASNASGTSAPSVPSRAVKTANVPSPPQSVAASASGQTVQVSWTAPANNGSAITGYTATASDNASTCTAGPSVLSCDIFGLAWGTTYTFTVVASNQVGASASSAPSSGVLIESTPDAPSGASMGSFGYTPGANGATSGTLSWSAPASDNGSAITGYAITGLPGCGSSSGTSCGTGSLLPAAGYTACVYAENSVGQSSGDSCVSFETPDGYEFGGPSQTPVFPAANDGNPGGPLYELSGDEQVTVVCRVWGQTLNGDSWWYELTNGDYVPADDCWNSPLGGNFNNGILVDASIPTVC